VIVAGIDTATPATVTGVLLPDGAVVEARDEPEEGSRGAHASRLLVLLERALDEGGVAWADVDRIAVGVGPGGFTGLRIGIATARALAQGRGLALVPVSSLAALAAGATPAAVANGAPLPLVAAVIDARRGEVFAAVHRGDHTVLGPAALAPSDLADRLLGLDAPVQAVGDGAVRFREELEFHPTWILAGGLGFEQSMISIQSINYEGATPLRVNADRTYYNWAPELSLTWKPADGYRHWIRASTGYAIPQFNNLLRNPFTGQPGTNFDLRPQKNLNTEIGTESRIAKDLVVELVGFWTFFKNEIITQTISGSNTASVNADSSQYRGIEARYDWRPLSGLRFSGAYTHIDAMYINFSDRTVTGLLVRDGNKVPNVPTDIFNTKVEYDHAMTGWGGWVEGSYYNSYFLNNSNTFGIPSYFIANVNVHKFFEFSNSWVRFAKFYLQLDNIADMKYAASGQVIGGETSAVAATQQAFFAGYGRAIYGGVTLGLF